MMGKYIAAEKLIADGELRQAIAADRLIESSKTVHAAYREHAELVKDVYDWAKAILDYVFDGQEYSLPIDVRNVAAKLGFTISIDDFSEVERQYFKDGHRSLPIAQLKMRQKLFGSGSETICGTIHLANYLSENSIRFSIAHELGHFALREHNPIGSSLVLEACPGLYPMVDTDEMLADLFAYALLLPHGLFKKEREEYEKDRTHWPLDYAEWIEYIRDKAQIPEYYAILACQEIKKYDIYLKCKSAEKNLDEKLRSFGIIELCDQRAARDLYAITINRLESWGFTCEQVADILFGETKTSTEKREDENKKREDNKTIVVIMHDFYMCEQRSQLWEQKWNVEKEYSSKLKKHIINRLSKVADLSANGICEMTTIPLDEVNEILACPDDVDVQ